MIERIRKALKTIDMDHWKVLKEDIEGKELFLIRDKVDMNRSKNVTFYHITLYKDFEESGKKFTGSSKIKIGSSLDDKGLIQILEKAALAAKFVKNPYYPMVEPEDKEIYSNETIFQSGNLVDHLNRLKEIIYTEGKDSINSAEIFLNKINKNLWTSKGIELSSKKYQCTIEIITDAEGESEAVELFDLFSFSHYEPNELEHKIKSQIENCSNRAKAKETKELKGLNVILGTNDVKKMMNFYAMQSDASYIFQGLSKAEVGEVFQGDEVKGDLLTMDLNPSLPNSTESFPFDEDGIILNQINLFTNGELKNLHGSKQYSSYLNQKASGIIENLDVKGGKLSLEDFKKESYVEILAFSAFQMNSLTGDFGGEIRLARYFDGERIQYITGASLSANLFKIQKEYYLSKEIVDDNNYRGPKALMFTNGIIAGS